MFGSRSKFRPMATQTRNTLFFLFFVGSGSYAFVLIFYEFYLLFFFICLLLD
jgi:hypothetical protein